MNAGTVLNRPTLNCPESVSDALTFARLLSPPARRVLRDVTFLAGTRAHIVDTNKRELNELEDMGLVDAGSVDWIPNKLGQEVHKLLNDYRGRTLKPRLMIEASNRDRKLGSKKRPKRNGKKRTYKKPKYKQYDPKVEGYGNPDQWASAFGARMKSIDVAKALGGDSALSVLGLATDPTQKELKSAYRKKTMEYHPDRYNGKDAESMTRKVRAAYEILLGAQP